ncbi:MAG: hypothetical protein PUI29_06120 [Aeromonadales bacterium]|nr:hypothetical protein [Aeromonadales bacterium]MDY2890214.1 hypothetical protein [Succinivibrio sp.]
MLSKILAGSITKMAKPQKYGMPQVPIRKIWRLAASAAWPSSSPSGPNTAVLPDGCGGSASCSFKESRKRRTWAAPSPGQAIGSAPFGAIAKRRIPLSPSAR